MATTQQRGMRAAIYTRISADRYAEAEGVERQREACEKLAADRGLDVVAIFVDNNRSAMHGKRPAREQLLAAVDNGEIDVVIVWATDRLYRKLSDLVELMNVLRDTPVYSVRSGEVDLSNADGRLRANIMGSVAQHESEVKAERVSAAAAQRASRGRFSGGNRRFGYEHVTTRTVMLHRDGETTEMQVPTGQLRLVKAEAEAIRWAYNHVLQGGTLQSVRREWNERGLTGGNGGVFTAATVRKVLLRPMNAGLATYKGRTLAATHEAPAIVSIDIWNGTRSLLTNPKRQARTGAPAKSLLAPLLRCNVCLETGDTTYKAGMSAKARVRASQGTRDLIYACRSKGHVSRTRSKLDPAIEAIVVQYLIENAALLRRPRVQSARVAKAEHEAAALREQIAKYTARAGDMDVDDFISAVTPLRVKLNALEKASVQVSGRPATGHLLNSKDIHGAWNAMTVEEKRTVIMENISRITIGPGLMGSRTATMFNIELFDIDGKTIEWTGWPAATGGDLTHAEAMAEWMPEMTEDTAKAISAAMFPASA